MAAPAGNNCVAGLDGEESFFFFVGEQFPGEDFQTAVLRVLNPLALFQVAGVDDDFIFAVDNCVTFHLGIISGVVKYFFFSGCKPCLCPLLCCYLLAKGKQ